MITAAAACARPQRKNDPLREGMLIALCAMVVTLAGFPVPRILLAFEEYVDDQTVLNWMLNGTVTDD